MSGQQQPPQPGWGFFSAVCLAVWTQAATDQLICAAASAKELQQAEEWVQLQQMKWLLQSLPAWLIPLQLPRWCCDKAVAGPHPRYPASPEHYICACTLLPLAEGAKHDPG